MTATTIDPRTIRGEIVLDADPACRSNGMLFAATHEQADVLNDALRERLQRAFPAMAVRIGAEEALAIYADSPEDEVAQSEYVREFFRDEWNRGWGRVMENDIGAFLGNAGL